MIDIYTDAGYRPNTNVAGWAYTINYFDIKNEAAGSFVIDMEDTSGLANHLEMIAIINACDQIKDSWKSYKIRLFTDSDYCYKTYLKIVQGDESFKNTDIDVIVQFREMIKSFDNLDLIWIKRRSDTNSRIVDNMVKNIMDKKEYEIELSKENFYD